MNGCGEGELKGEGCCRFVNVLMLFKKGINLFAEPVVTNQSHKSTHSPPTGRLCKEGE